MWIHTIRYKNRDACWHVKMVTQNLLKLLLLLMLMMRNSLLQGGAEGGLPQKSFGGQAAVEEIPQYHHRPSPSSMLLSRVGVVSMHARDAAKRSCR